MKPPHSPPPPYIKTRCPAAHGVFNMYPPGSYYDTCNRVFWKGIIASIGNGVLEAICESKHGGRVNRLDVHRCCKPCEKNDGNDDHYTDVILWNDFGTLRCEEPIVPSPNGCP